MWKAEAVWLGGFGREVANFADFEKAFADGFLFAKDVLHAAAAW